MFRMLRSLRFVGQGSWLVMGALVLFIALALLLRVCLPYNDIFVDGWVKFAGNDAYYYMRLVDNMTQNFPHVMAVDPYLAFPDGQGITAYLLFARLITIVSWAIGFGHPTQHLVDVVGVYMPAVLGALVTIPVYFIGKELGSRWVGLISAGLIAIMPGEFLGRSILGFTDHHIAEVFFSSFVALFLIKAVKDGRQRNLSFNGLRCRENIKAIIYSILAGVFLGIYLLTWLGGLLFVFITTLYLSTQFILNHWRNKDSSYLCVVGILMFTVAMAMFLPTAREMVYGASMVVALMFIVVLGSLSWLLRRRGLKQYYYPLTVFGVAVFGLGFIYLVFPSVFESMMGKLVVFIPTSTQMTTMELYPLLFPNSNFSLSVAWVNFGLIFYIGLITLLLLAWGVIKRGDDCITILVMWSLVILVMTLLQRRFAYYFAVNLALLSGYSAWLVLRWVGFKSYIARGQRKRKAARRWVGMKVGVAGVIVFGILFVPVIPATIDVARHASYAPSNSWCSSLDWLRENSPKPFSEINAYYQLEVQSEPAYGILSWWDYGYWITRMSQRIPNASPSQDPLAQGTVASFFTSQDEKSASEIIYGLGSEYVIIDFATAVNKFWAIARYSTGSEFDYFGVYYVPRDNQLLPVVLYYPNYYHSLSTRLYNFDGRAVIPQRVTAVAYEQRKDENGQVFNLVTDALQFSAYEDAEVYISRQLVAYRIVGDNPFISPVRLEAISDYELIYKSKEKVSLFEEQISDVKIFRYKGSNRNS